MPGHAPEPVGGLGPVQRRQQPRLPARSERVRLAGFDSGQMGAERRRQCFALNVRFQPTRPGVDRFNFQGATPF